MFLIDGIQGHDELARMSLLYFLLILVNLLKGKKPIEKVSEYVLSLPHRLLVFLSSFNLGFQLEKY